MAQLTLHIANKNYSSWSFRPWIAMRVAKIEFVENLVPFDFPSGNAAFRRFSPTGCVPVLQDGDLVVWESLAIIDYCADRFPEHGLWPDQPRAKATARAMAAEMHAGFHALRSACPMNMRRERRAISVSCAVKADVRRIVTSWFEAISRSGGPFLFGAFSAADAMYAPIVNRLDVYELTEDRIALSYMERIKALPAWQEWERAARAEPWVVAEDEV
ncbi:glutathione S-transferase family protein [Pararhizobium haloflavum]|uniref:glutathione S-transferase family protein n=1 Tax=Pararhizobium haloflavum TaxID=2037914 RepID=UPI000C188BE1|nr:glutathione S-transferase family protein [Pararhizobium haloflavum]